MPDGNGGSIRAKHEPFMDARLFEEVQKQGTQRATGRPTVRSDASVYSLSGMARCADCGNTLRSFKGRGRVRLVCNGRLSGGGCAQSSTFLDIYEQQLVAYPGTFCVPDDYQEKIMEPHRKLQAAYDEETRRKVLESRLRRTEELYEWGHKKKEEYLSDHAAIQRELRRLIPPANDEGQLQRLAAFLKDIRLAWDQAGQKQRNQMVACLFDTVWIKDKKVTAVTPREDFKPFFDLQCEGMSHYVLHWRPRGDSNP